MKPTRPGRNLILALVTGAIAAFTMSRVMALDTDIYFSNPNASQQAVRPNVLLILDTSGSMNQTVDNGQGKSRLTHMKEALNTILDNSQNVNIGLMRFSSSPGGPVLYPISDLDAVLGAATTVIETPLAASSDDAEQPAGGGTPILGDLDLNMTNSAGTTQIVGMRFQSVVVPRRATIKKAFIRFAADETHDALGFPTSLVIKGQEAANPGTFAAVANDVSNRTAGSTVSVAWSSLPGWIAGESHVTPDLTPIVQKIVDLDGWCGGNAMVFTIEGTGTRVAKSFDGSAGEAPVLVVEYELDALRTGGAACVQKTLQVKVENANDDAEERRSNGSVNLDNTLLNVTFNGSADQYVGIRFNSVPIPAGATVVSAHIDFTDRGTGSGTPTLSIVGQKTPTPGSFNDNRRNISNRIDTASEKTSSITWSNILDPASGTVTTPDLKTIVQELVNQPGGWTSGNPMLFVFETASGSGHRVFEAHDRSSTDNPATLRVTYQVDATSTVETTRTRLKQIVNGIVASGLTPIVDSLYEAGLYFRGQNVLYGLKRGPQNGSEARFTRVSHPDSYTGATGVFREADCTDSNLNDPACETEAIQGTPTYISPFQPGCQNNYIILLTDGDPTVNNSELLIESLIGQQCADPTGLGATQFNNGRCAQELVSYYFNTDLSGLADSQQIKTFTIGFASEGSPAYLQAIAEAGGSGADGFKVAGNASELTAAFQQILGQVIEDPTSFVSPSLSVNAFNKLFNRDEVYFSLFSPRLEVNWPGNIKKFQLCADATNQTCTFGEVLDAVNQEAIGTDSKIKLNAKSIWSTVTDGPLVELGGAGEHVTVSGTRNVYTYNPTDPTVDVPPSPVDLTGSAHVVNTTNIAITKEQLGDPLMTDTRREEIIKWMRGQDVTDADNDGDVLEDRWKFADALHSRPLTVTYGGTNAAPVIKMFVGTNEGGLRLIDTETGKEEWIVYIPEFLNKQAGLMDNAQGLHIKQLTVGLDGTPTAHVIDSDGDGVIDVPGDKVFLYIGERRGGRDIYAFDVTPTSTLSTPGDPSIGLIKPKFMWRIRGGSGSFVRLGETWSRPLLTRIPIKCQNQTACGDGVAETADSETKDVLIFAGGYDPRLDEPGPGKVIPDGVDGMGNAIYMVDPLNGSLVWWASGTGSGANLELAAMNYAIPSDLALIDTNHDGAVDRIYVGDTRGQLFRIDLGNQIDPGVAGDGGSRGYVFADVGCEGDTRANGCAATAHHNRRKFFFPPDVAQVEDSNFSSTPEYDLVTIASGDREDPLDKLTGAITGTDPVHNRLYAFRDVNWKTGPAPTDINGNPPATLTDADLYDATANELQDPSSATYANAVAAIRAADGWFIDLKEPTAPTWIGEKGLARPVIFDGVLFVTSFVPSAGDDTQSESSCAPLAEGIGRLYALNYLIGTAEFDWNNDGTLDRQFQVGSGIPSEAVIVIREGGVTTLVGTSGGAASPDAKLNMPRYQTYWLEE